jgi:hypothetical protein
MTTRDKDPDDRLLDNHKRGLCSWGTFDFASTPRCKTIHRPKRLSLIIIFVCQPCMCVCFKSESKARAGNEVVLKVDLTGRGRIDVRVSTGFPANERIPISGESGRPDSARLPLNLDTYPPSLNELESLRGVEEVDR